MIESAKSGDYSEKIFWNTGAWYCNTAYYSDLGRGLQDAGWIYLPDYKLWMTKNDHEVDTRRSMIIKESDREILTNRLMQRQVRYLLSSAKSSERVLHPDLFDFQNVSPPEILDRNILLADDMGLGKTVQAIMAINELKPANVLIIVPNMLVMSWYDEIEKWLTSTDTLVYVCPWSRLIKMDLSAYWDLIIVDEAHYAKNSGSKRSKAFSALQAKRKMCLTGTPTLGRPDEIYPIIDWLEPGLLGTQADFDRRYMTRNLKRIRTRYGYKWVVSGFIPKNMHELQKLLRETVMISRKKSDVLSQLPEKMRSVITLDVSVEIKKLDNQLMTLWEAAQGDQKSDMKLWNSIFTIRKEASLLKLPMVNSFIDEILEDIISEEEKRPIVIWAHHHEMIDGISDHIKSQEQFDSLTVEILDGRVKPDDRSKIVKSFQEGGVDVLVAGLTAAGVGITLTRGDIAIFAELDWTPANMVQAEDRLHRIGQTHPVNIYYCVSPLSIDGRLANILATKQGVIDAFSDSNVTLADLMEDDLA